MPSVTPQTPEVVIYSHNFSRPHLPMSKATRRHPPWPASILPLLTIGTTVLIKLNKSFLLSTKS